MNIAKALRRKQSPGSASLHFQGRDAAGATAKEYEAWIAQEIEKCRALESEATDEQFRNMLEGRLLGCIFEAVTRRVNPL